MVLLKISFALLLGSALSVLAIPHGLKVEPHFAKRAECTSGIQASLHKFSVGRVGNVHQLNLADRMLGSLLFTAGNSGAGGGIAVNSNGAQLKASTAGIFTATQGTEWVPETGFTVPSGVDYTAAGALPDGRFVFGSYTSSGRAYLTNADMTSVTSITYSDVLGNLQDFCGDPLSCTFDIAFDGIGHAWVIDYKGNLFISMLSQLVSPGGLMKHIGRIKWDYPESSASATRSNGIAFDAEGHVYYSLYTATTSNGATTYKTFVVRASTITPLVTTVVIDPIADTVISDLASCYFPTVDITSLLN